MELTKEKTIDLIEIVENGVIQVREIIKVLEDGNVISASYHRSSFAPGDDVSQQDTKVKAVAKAIWTSEVIASYKKLTEVKEIGGK